ncbi:Lipoprotein [Candidatus Electronema halotolerans]
MITGRMRKPLLLLVAALSLLSGCSVKEKAKEVWEKMPLVPKQQISPAFTYPSTGQARTIFQAEQAQPGCKVFAHLLIWTPTGATGLSIAQAAEQEAAFYGADMLLIGRTRLSKDEDGMRFIYYGPDQPYSCQDDWEGWKFGYEDWINQGGWVSMGYAEWGKPEERFNFPLVLQAAYLRCQGTETEQ